MQKSLEEEKEKNAANEKPKQNGLTTKMNGDIKVWPLKGYLWLYDISDVSSPKVGAGQGQPVTGLGPKSWPVDWTVAMKIDLELLLHFLSRYIKPIIFNVYFVK